MVILAHRRAAASMLAPFSYAQLLSSTLLGFAAFGAVPDRATLLGAAVIVLSGLYTAHRERIRAGSACSGAELFAAPRRQHPCMAASRLAPAPIRAEGA